MNYCDVKRSIILVILDFQLFNEEKEWYNQFRFKNWKAEQAGVDLNIIAECQELPIEVVEKL